MSTIDDILNGTYNDKKKKDSVIDQILSGEYQDPFANKKVNGVSNVNSSNKPQGKIKIGNVSNQFNKITSNGTAEYNKMEQTKLPINNEFQNQFSIQNKTTPNKFQNQFIKPEGVFEKKQRQEKEKKEKRIKQLEEQLPDLQKKLNTSVYSDSKKKEWQQEYNKLQKEYNNLTKDTSIDLVKTAHNGLIELGKGVVDFSESLLDTGLQLGTSKINPYYWFNPDQLEEHQELVKEIIKKDASQDFIDNTLGYNKKLANGKTVQQTLDENSLIKSDNMGGKIFRSTGRQLPSIILSGGAPSQKFSENMALSLMGADSYGSAVEEAYQNGASRGDANKYGLANALIETGTEKLTGGVKFFGKGTIDDVAERGINKINNPLARKVLKEVYDIGGEGFEEDASAFLNPYAKKLTYAKDKSIDELRKEEGSYGENFLMGAGGALLMKGLQAPSNIRMNNNSNIQNSSGTTNIEQNNIEETKLPVIKKNNQYNTLEELKNNTQINEKNTNIQELPTKTINNTNLQEINQNKVQNKQIAPVRTDINQENVANENTTTQNETQLLEKLKEIREQTTNKKEQAKLDTHIQQIENDVKNLSDNSKTFAQDNKTVNKYQYIESDNQKINDLRKDASNYWDNSEKTTNYVNMLEQIISDKDVGIRLDSNLTDENGRIANGKYENGVITINPNSNRTGEFIAIHELTHAIGTDSMRNIVEKYRKSNSEFDKAVTELLGKNYNTDQLTEEALADVSGQLFGNQEFINNLSENNPNVFKKIYNEIKYLWHQFKGYNNQNQFIKDLQYKWEQAYRKNNKLNDIKSFSRIYNNDGTVNRIKINDNIFEENNNKSISKTIKEYLENHIGEVYTIIESGQKVYLGEDLPNEYAYSEYTKSLPISKKLAKGRVASNLQEIIETAENRKWEANHKEKHKIDAKYGFYKYDTTFSFDHNGKEKIYDGTIVIRNDANGKKYLYDIVNIKPQKKLANLPSVASNSIKSSAINDGSSNQSVNNIPYSNKNVKSDISTKYSIQETQNDTQNNTDNQGRTLSKEQQEYFKDSKVKDDNGNLITLYHGTPNDFTIFNTKDFGGANGTAEGFGIYLTDNIEVADDYLQQDKGKVMNLYANITKPATTSNLTVNKQDIIKAIKELTYKDAQEMVNDGDYDNINDALKDTWISNYTYTYDKSIEQSYNDVAETILKGSENDYEVIQELMNGSGNNDYKNANDFYKTITDTLGFDGIQTKWDFSNDSELKKKNANIWIAFNSSQVKNIDNTKPTTDADIRYSKENKTWQEYLEKEFKAEGTTTNLKDIKLPTKEKTKLPTKEVAKKEVKQIAPVKETKKEVKLPVKEIPKNPTKESTYDEKAYDRKKQHEKLIKQEVKAKVKGESQKAINIATKVGQKYLELDRTQKAELKEQLSKYTGKTRKQLTNSKTWNEIKDIVNKYAEKQITYVDNEIQDIKTEIKNTKIKIDDNIKSQITDYNDFRKDNFGKLKLSKEGVSLDSMYQELSEQYPYYFNNATTEADMLYELSDFMNKDTNMYEKIKLDDATLERATTKIYNSLLQNTMNKDAINELKEEIQKKYNKRTRKIVQKELQDRMGITADDLQVGKDISSLEYQRTDPIRLHEKVFGYETGKKINDATINFTKHQEAERIRFLNKERNEIKDLGIKPRSKESAAVQKYGEKQYVNDYGEVKKYGDAELQAEFSDTKTQQKIKHAASVIRTKYDNYIDNINEVITEMGYDPIPKRKDYMRHFMELNDKLSQWGIPLNRESLSQDALPTDINGITDQFKPGKNWFASTMQRKGLKTTYDAITGIDGYLEGASNLMYHTESIQRYRTLSKLVRDTYGQTHGMENIDASTKEGQQRLNDIMDNKLSKYAAWLDEQANALAGKKGGIDRAAERILGRKVYSVLDTAKKQVGSNMTGFNVRSALTNFASAVQGASKTNKIAWTKGTLSTIKNIIHNDGLINKSDFLTSRFGSDQLSKKLWQKASNAGQIFMTGTDYFTANQIWRSKYYENLSKGMTEQQAIKNADDFSARIMGDRSKGSTAEIFNSKTLGLLTQFQLEVNNQWSSIVHDNKMDIQRGNKSGATVLFQLGQLSAMSYLFNNFMKSLTGSDVMIDPIDILKQIFGGDDDDDIEERAEKVLGDLVNDLPFVSFLTGGRIPISEAFTGANTFTKKITGQKDKWGNPIKWEDVKNDAISSGFYWLLPTGYGQIKKTTKGVSMYDSKLPVAGSYTKSGNLRFTADESTGGKIKAALFGQYTNDEARKYIESGYKTIYKTKIDEMKNLGMKSSEYREYRSGLSQAGTTNESKINYIVNLDNVSNKQKNIMASNLLSRDFNVNEYKKYDSYDEYNYAYHYPEKYSLITQITSYKKYQKYNDELEDIRDNTSNDKEETIKYINSLNLSIPQKAMYIKSYYKSFKQYDLQIINYINDQNLTIKEKTEILQQLGFTIKDGRVY